MVSRLLFIRRQSCCTPRSYASKTEENWKKCQSGKHVTWQRFNLIITKIKMCNVFSLISEQQVQNKCIKVSYLSESKVGIIVMRLYICTSYFCKQRLFVLRTIT
jgi:hypothetical protein